MARNILTNTSVHLTRAREGEALFGKRIDTPDQLKGGLVLSLENLGESYAPMYWIFGPRSDEGWPVKGVCPVVWGYVGVLYTSFPMWLRDELFNFAGRIARSETGANARQSRVRMLGRYAIEESFNLSEFSPIRRYKDRLLGAYDESPMRAYSMCRDLLNSVKAPSSGIPIISTLGSVSSVVDTKSDNHTRLWGSVLDVGKIPALVAEESRTRDEFLATWDRAVRQLSDILLVRG